jgi:hypothetical protein
VDKLYTEKNCFVQTETGIFLHHPLTIKHKLKSLQASYFVSGQGVSVASLVVAAL